MAGLKEIRSQIGSIQNTSKITKAMEMVAASKMRRAKERMEESRPYADKMRQVVGHLANGHLEYKHPYTVQREDVKRVGYIIISTDRGLCGGLNTNLFKAAFQSMADWKEQGAEVEIAVLGGKALSTFRRYGVVAERTQIGDKPELLPIVAAEQEKDVASHWDYLYEPESETVIDRLMVRYIESLVYQGVVENIACEMSARMIAMKSASDNAANIIDDLKLAYNKARQASITQEISEIVSGAAAVE